MLLAILVNLRRNFNSLEADSELNSTPFCTQWIVIEVNERKF